MLQQIWTYGQSKCRATDIEFVRDDAYKHAYIQNGYGGDSRRTYTRIYTVKRAKFNSLKMHSVVRAYYFLSFPSVKGIGQLGGVCVYPEALSSLSLSLAVYGDSVLESYLSTNKRSCSGRKGSRTDAPCCPLRS